MSKHSIERRPPRGDYALRQAQITQWFRVFWGRTRRSIASFLLETRAEPGLRALLPSARRVRMGRLYFGGRGERSGEALRRFLSKGALRTRGEGAFAECETSAKGQALLLPAIVKEPRSIASLPHERGFEDEGQGRSCQVRDESEWAGYTLADAAKEVRSMRRFLSKGALRTRGEGASAVCETGRMGRPCFDSHSGRSGEALRLIFLKGL